MTNTLELAIAGMSCGHCVATVEQALAAVPGVDRAAVSVGRAQLTLTSLGERHTVEMGAIEAIRKAGFAATLQDASAASAPSVSVAPTSCCGGSRSATSLSSR